MSRAGHPIQVLVSTHHIVRYVPQPQKKPRPESDSVTHHLVGGFNPFKTY